MKSLAIIVAAYAAFAAPAALAADAAVFAPIQAMVDGFNKGDIAAVKAAHVAAPTIVDNVAPFVWSGPAAFDTWIADLARVEAAEGKADGVVWFGKPEDEVVAGDRAYLTTPCSYVYMQHGKKMREEGMTAFTLVRQGGAWKVESWAWASPAAVPAK